MPLTPEQQDLREAAKAATQGKWIAQHEYDGERLTDVDTGNEFSSVLPENGSWPEDVICEVWSGNHLDEPNAKFIAAANPAAILAILAQLEGCNEDYGQAVDSVAQLQDEVFEVRAQLEAQEAPDKPRSPFANSESGTTSTESALQALADQAQELGMGYEGMLMPSPPGSAVDADVINTIESLSAAEGSMEDFADAADLVDAMTSAEAKGDALGLVLSYRHKVRSAAPSQSVQPDTDKLLAIIASTYQIAGAHDVLEHILDVLADPEAATVEQVEAMLPYQAGAVADERKE